MSYNNQETIADIVSEMRLGVKDCRGERVGIFDSFADRIEAAAKREREAGAEAAQICGEIGEKIVREEALKEKVTDCNQFCNAANMREALSDACYAMFNFLKTQNGGLDEIANALDKAKSALADHPRNCDVGTPEEQSDRFDKFCYSYNSCSKCPIKSLWNSSNRKEQLREIIRCEIIWSKMPYEEVK